MLIFCWQVNGQWDGSDTVLENYQRFLMNRRWLVEFQRNYHRRYHFVGLENVFYQRPPYKTNNFASRLIALGGVE